MQFHLNKYGNLTHIRDSISLNNIEMNECEDVRINDVTG
jgi:hypothetical protein